jgi:xanthine dehydrogenase molybdopterin-binding subunit B
MSSNCVYILPTDRSSTAYLHIRGPQGEVVTEKLHDQGAILVGIFPKGIQLGNGLIEGL